MRPEEVVGLSAGRGWVWCGLRGETGTGRFSCKALKEVAHGHVGNKTGQRVTEMKEKYKKKSSTRRRVERVNRAKASGAPSRSCYGSNAPAKRGEPVGLPPRASRACAQAKARSTQAAVSLAPGSSPGFATRGWTREEGKTLGLPSNWSVGLDLRLDRPEI